MPAHLVTIGVSHFCEKARWALDRAGWHYTEERHVPIFHYAASFRIAGQRTVPILHLPHGNIGDSTAIVEFVDRELAEPDRLFPHDPALLAQVTELEDMFDRRLGPATRRYAYSHLVDAGELFVDTIAAGAPRAERIGARVFSKGLAMVMKRGLKLDPAGAARSKERLEEVLDTVENRLADGRRFLTGSRFTAADLTFAALLAPVLLLEEYPSPLPSLAATPPALALQVREWRARPAGLFATRLYQEERRRIVPSAKN